MPSVKEDIAAIREHIKVLNHSSETITKSVTRIDKRLFRLEILWACVVGGIPVFLYVLSLLKII